MKVSDRAVDRLYIWLGVFTSFYIGLIAFEFFTNWHLRHPTFEIFLDSLKDPYLGALAVYVVLKELRKHHRHEHFFIHRGEYFVFTWSILFIATTVAVVFTEQYRFDVAYSLVVTNSLASLILYLGSRLHKP